MKSILPKSFFKHKSPKKKPKNIPIPRFPSRPKTAVVQKCELCGEEAGKDHRCSKGSKNNKNRFVGLRTYYNISGKKVHDQQTQTPVEFYPKILKFREELEALFFNTKINKMKKPYNSKSNDQVLPTINRSVRPDGKRNLSFKELVANRRESQSRVDSSRVVLLQKSATRKK